MKSLDYHPEARLEADAAAAYYHGDNPAVASRFLDELEKVTFEIQEAPQRWPFESGTFAQRRHLSRFPFTIFYLNDLHEIFILAIAHTSRRPGYWKQRIAG